MKLLVEQGKKAAVAGEDHMPMHAHGDDAVYLDAVLPGRPCEAVEEDVLARAVSVGFQEQVPPRRAAGAHHVDVREHGSRGRHGPTRLIASSVPARRSEITRLSWPQPGDSLPSAGDPPPPLRSATLRHGRARPPSQLRRASSVRPTRAAGRALTAPMARPVAMSDVQPSGRTKRGEPVNPGRASLATQVGQTAVDIATVMRI